MSKLRNNKGLTLVELLVVLVLASGIMIATTSIFISASKNNARIMQEIKIRDEADYLMSLFVKEFYSLNKKDIVEDMVTSPDVAYVKYTVNFDDIDDIDDIEELDESLSVYEAAEIWASHGKDEDYMFGYTEEELEDAL